MDEPTTTEPVAPVIGAEEVLPVASEPVVAADAPVIDEPSTPSAGAEGEEGDEPQDPSTPDVDDKLQKFAQSQGIDLDSPSAIKAAKIALKSQQDATRNYHKSNELEKASAVTPDQLPADITPQQDESIRIRSLELRIEAQSWKAQNPDKAALEPQMVEILQADPNKKLLIQEGYLSYDDLYKMARGSVDNSASVKSQGKREALQSLAHKQQAAVPTGNATTTASPKQKEFKDLSIAEMEAKLGTVQR